MDFVIGDLILERLPRWRAYARLLTRNRAAAEDLVQDTVVRILTSSSQFDGSNFTAWSNAILRNRFLDDCRRARFRGGSIEDVPVAAITLEATQEGTVELEETLRALERLAPNYRDVLVLKCIEDFSYARTARRLKIPLGTVRSRLFRARAELSAAVKGNRGGHDNGEIRELAVPPKARRTRRANRPAAKVRSANAGPDERLAQQRHEQVGAHV
jgi:RNA polymerase sigma-70 factor (ECF subfamily)